MLPENAPLRSFACLFVRPFVRFACPSSGAIAPLVKRRDSAARRLRRRPQQQLVGIQHEVMKLEADRVRLCVARSQLLMLPCGRPRF